MTSLPSVEPLPHGTRPTEPGWYVVEDIYGRMVVEISDTCRDIIHFSGVSATARVESFTFIARIYPERIGGA